MTLALMSLLLPLASALVLLVLRARSPVLMILATLGSLIAAAGALYQVVDGGEQLLALGGWEPPLGIRFRLTPLSGLLLVFTALIHLLVAFYAAASRHSQTRHTDYWPLSGLLHASLVALWLSNDLFNWYVTLELLGLVAVALVTLAGPKAYRAAMRYLILSLVASLFYLLGVALLYGRYGVLDVALLASLTEADATTHTALLLMTLGLMLKAALWPLHLWLPPAHAGAPTAVSALLSALVVKGPLFILWLIWSEIAPPALARDMGFIMALAGVAALLSGGWSAMRTPYIKTLVAYSTVAQLGYALMALGLLLYWELPELHVALWLFVLSHGLAKVSMFLAAGEMQATLGSKRISALTGATQTMPVAMFAFAVAGGSLIGLPPSGGFLAKWLLLQPLFAEPANWFWAFAVLLGTLASAVYVFRVVALAFDRAKPTRPDFDPHVLAQWLALIPALLVWGMALVSQPLILWLTGVTH
ncbi:complex I subunit 5 family protein [Marinimicrobium alkaliphilum]|uniref:complex I subunit 5 family protein n=1 Tax=Marinimicrobium alkaliphilum TaxID=2202654 RepID=UPI000DBA8563|nr:proton-conducting transporter membrane subunit [Marinimicrobium alkaliphilum]